MKSETTRNPLSERKAPFHIPRMFLRGIIKRKYQILYSNRESSVCRVKQQTLHSLAQIKTQKHCFELVHNVSRGLCVQTNSASCQPGNSSGTHKKRGAFKFINQIDAKANKPHAQCVKCLKQMQHTLKLKLRWHLRSFSNSWNAFLMHVTSDYLIQPMVEENVLQFFLTSGTRIQIHICIIIWI